jgi:iron complex outermembrane receptor protein
MVATSDRTIGYRNGGELSIRGFEMQAELRWARHTRLLANYAHVRIGPDMDSTTFASNGDRLRFKDFGEAMPRDSFSLLAWHKFGHGWTGSLSYYQTHETEMPADGDFVRIARHTDARLARQFDLGNHQLELALIAQNLFDQGYHEFASYNTSERRSFVQLRMDF